MMANGWNGPDPVVDLDPTAYELGTEYLVNSDITITGVRIWAASSEINLPGRTATIWTTGGGVLTTENLATDLPDGWSVTPLTTPVPRTAGSRFVVSYGTGGNEGSAVHALDTDVVSADGAVTALGFASATGNQNGRFHVGAGVFPTAGNANHSFYGADVVYTLGIGGNTAPAIQDASVTVSGVQATATIVATDAESLTGAVYRYDWGDGSPVDSTNQPTITKSHNYSVPGIYPVLLSVTDSDGLADYVARYAIVEPTPDLTGTLASDVLDLLVSRTKATKQFAAVLKHEPRTAPRHYVTAAFFLGAPNAAPGGFQTVKRVSSLATAGMRLDVICRLYMDAKKEVAWNGRPPSLDNIDQVLLEHAEVILRECHSNVSFGIQDSGVWTDADGADSEGLGGLFGYLDHDTMKFRICEIYIPVILTDYFTQGNP
jgi:hypothetical protein